MQVSPNFGGVGAIQKVIFRILPASPYQQVYHSQDISMLPSLYFEEGKIQDAYDSLAIVAKSGKIPALEFSLLCLMDILTKALRLCGVHTRGGQTYGNALALILPILDSDSSQGLLWGWDILLSE